MDFEDFEESAEQELKRADHLLYVTLKYTRTAEVIKNTIKRLVNAYDFGALEALHALKFKNIPDVPRQRMKILGGEMPQFKKEVDFYILMKNIDAASFKAKDEYRKNVTLLTDVENVNAPKLEDYFKRTVEFIRVIRELVETKGKKK